MKRLRKILLLCGVLTAFLCVCVRAEDTLYAANGGNLHFDKANGTIMDCDETVTKVVIPSEIKGVAVTAIGEEAFADCKKLISVKIPRGVTAIGNGAFRDCVSMESAEIPDTLTQIGDEAFSGCRSLESVTIPDGVTRIGERAFQGCRSVKSVTIPGSVISVGNGAFLDCDKLKSIDADSSNTAYASADGVLFNAEGTRLLRYPPAKGAASYIVPYGVTYIAEWAFSDCMNLTEVNIPYTVVTLEDGAFFDCENLCDVNLPENVASVGRDAFRNCAALTEITIPNGVTAIREETFSGCAKLRRVTIPQSVLTIRDNAFEGCGALESVEIPNRVSSVGDAAFRDCASLTGIEIPNGVLIIGENAFQNCAKLAFAEIPVSVSSIGWDAFENCEALRNVYYAGSAEQWGRIEELNHSGLLSDAIAIHYDSAGPDKPEIKLTSPPLVGKQILKTSDLRGLKELTIPLTTNAETPLEITFMTPFYDAKGRFIGMGTQTESVDKNTKSVVVPVTESVTGATEMKILLCGAKKPLCASLRYHITD